MQVFSTTVAESDASPRSGRDTLPLMHFVLDEPARRSDTHAQVSPALELVRGEPVAITIVNHLDEPTVVHWHGIEVEDSYMDGAAGFSGAGEHLAPAIAPGDSFVARFTPPRSGTIIRDFMLHRGRHHRPDRELALEEKAGAGLGPAKWHLNFVPALARALAPVRQVLSMGETYDFEYAPVERGTLHLEVWSNPLPLFPIRQLLLLSVPIRVE